MTAGVRSSITTLRVGELLERAHRLDWIGTLGPQSDGGTATSPRVFRMDERDRTEVFGGTLRELLKVPELGLPSVGEIEYVRAWGSSTPRGAPIDLHAHDGDLVVCLYLQADDLAGQALEFVVGDELVNELHPEPGLVAAWPSSLPHRVRPGLRGGADRIALVWNLTVRKGAVAP